MLTEEKISKILQGLMDIKDAIKDNNLLLKNYKIQSERLTELKKMKRDVQEQMEEEKRAIESQLLEDDDYASCKEEDMKLKEKYKESLAQLRAVASTIKTDQALTTFKFTFEGGLTQVDIERDVRIHLNGREIK